MLSNPFHTLLYLLFDMFTTRRDAQIQFLREENRILRSRLNMKRLIVSPEERKRLLKICCQLKHQVKELISIVQFRTYQLWVKGQQSGKKPGRVGRPSPRKIGIDIRELIIRLAKENSRWGYLRIVGELFKLRIKIGKTSVRRILMEEGMHPHPSPGDRSSRPDFQPWQNFIDLHMNTLVACDFFVKNTWSDRADTLNAIARSSDRVYLMRMLSIKNV